LKRIFSNDEFSYNAFNFNALNYNIISEQNLIILNELKSIPESLTNAIISFNNNGGIVLIIPSEKSILNTYNQLFTRLNFIQFDVLNSNNKKVTNINYSHPLFKGVFEKQVTKFQYPKVESNFPVSHQKSASILQLEDGNPLLVSSNGFFVFTAALNKENSNFINSSLIVPTLYNIGKLSLKIPKLYYTIGNPNTIDVPIIMQQDAILKLANNSASIIPLQQTFANKVSLFIDEEIGLSGNYKIANNTEVISNVSFNYNRSESNLHYIDMTTFKDVTVSDSFTNAFATIKSDTKVNELWKWFVTFAILFLILELLILKYFK
jgi:hypothetical protein